MVFVVGGLAYQELVGVQSKWPDDNSVVLGSNCIMNPGQFLQAVATMHRTQEELEGREEEEDDEDDSLV